MPEEIENRKRGAPRGNQNARKHGFYSRVLSQEETDKELAEKIITEINSIKDEELTMPKIARFLRALAETRR